MPTNPEASTSSSGNPAAGTILPSRPWAVPTKTTFTPDFWAHDLLGDGDSRKDVAARAAGRDDEGAEVAHDASATSCCEMLRIRPPAIQEATSDEPP